jgi:hypothetical protein
MKKRFRQPYSRDEKTFQTAVQQRLINVSESRTAEMKKYFRQPYSRNEKTFQEAVQQR